MKLWDDIRNYFYQNNIANKLSGKNYQRTLTNLKDAQKIGIIYDSTNPDNDIIITKFAEQLRQERKTVDILGFIADQKIDRKADIAIFNQQNLTWYLSPADERVEKFANQEFDLLLAAFAGEILPLEYIVRISKAKWRVGCFDEKKTDYYELMINMSGKTEVKYFLEQATHFLNQIQYDSN